MNYVYAHVSGQEYVDTLLTILSSSPIVQFRIMLWIDLDTLSYLDVAVLGFHDRHDM